MIFIAILHNKKQCFSAVGPKTNYFEQLFHVK